MVNHPEPLIPVRLKPSPLSQVLDLAHNHLDRLNLDTLLSAQLQFLDISCNSRLHVDPRQFQSYSSSRRPLSLVDVSGQNKTSSCSNGGPGHARGRGRDPEQQHLPWRLGFTETPGSRERYLYSFRFSAMCNSAGISAKCALS